jgi:amino acid adenylation domain-containing protein
MDTYNTFSCFIIGEGTLPLQCAKILLERKHAIYGIISSDLAVQDWARERGIPHIDPKNKDIVTFLSQHPFDYLFSIVNMYILPERVLALPRRCAINFHDAPLPRYAGRYATTWAIMQGERVHGVTWHAMTELVDAGDIFKQYLLEIADGETAFTLNAKCYDAAIVSFAELIDDIAYDRVSARKQNLDERTFFPLDKIPSSGCTLSWNRSARDIGAFVRALDFGSYPNPIGLPKLAVGMDVIIVSEVEVLNAMSAVPPGTVTRLAPGFVRVSTMDGDIALRKLLTIDGQPLPIADFVAKFGLYEGYQFKELDQQVATRIAAYNASIYKHEAFWTKQLETLENITLPYAHWKTSSVPATQSLYVPMPVSKEIINLLENRYTMWHLGDFFLAAFAAYLARIAGVWSFTIGYRGIELESELVDLEGIFAADVPLHVNMEYEQSFDEVFHAVQEQVKLAKKRKTYARDIMARYPVLRARANLQGAHLPSICVERVEALHDYKAPRGSELTLVIREDGVECLWVYNADVLDEESVVEMQHGFTTFLQGIVSDPERRLSDLPLLTKAEQSRLLVEWNATQAAYPKDKCLHQLFEAQVVRTPDAVAVIFEDEQLTYRELNGKANQLAHHLQQHGVGPEVLVGLCVERSLDMLVGLLGILKAGGAYVPLDPTFPPERLAFMLQDAQMAVLLTQQHLLAQLPAHDTKVICLDADAAALTQQSEANSLSATTSSNLAYVIYTSGSTGRPKGVQVLHRAVVNFMLSMRQQPGLTRQDTLLAITTLSFDIAALELFLPLLVGARVIVASQDSAADGAALAEALTRARVTVMQATPITWRLLLAAGWQGKPDLKILCGGEALPLDLAQQLLPRVASLWNMYGPTETTIWSTLCKIEAEERTVTIGRPIANTQIYLLDPQLQPVPVGVPGELYIGGDGMARGYLNRPELTAERFILHPFSNEPGARLYKTGDLARYRRDGTIEHLGRLDYQIKLRGFRIELGEIEVVLALHPAVRQAVVVAHEDVPGDKYLVAYVVLHEKQTATVDDLQSHVTKQLPYYMVPSAFVLLEAFPLTPNGKIDRRALPAPQHTRPALQMAFVAPRTLIEEALARMWAETLGIEQIGIYDDFVALGGDSLKALQVVARLRRALQIELHLARFFEAGTIAELSKIIEQVKAGDAQLQIQALQPISGEAHRGESSSILSTQDSGNSRVASAQHKLEGKGSATTKVAVQASGSKRPFFFLHGDYENGASYSFPLARNLGPDQPFYALDPYRFDILGVPPTLEAMAAAHLESLRSVQPEGPYLLGGFCNGGVVAYEMARQLHAQGETVDLLVLIDPSPLSYMQGKRRIINLLGRLMQLNAMEYTIFTTYSVGVIKRLGRLVQLSESKQVYCFLWLRHMYCLYGYGFQYLRQVYRYLRHAYRYLRYSRYRKLKDSERLRYFGLKNFTDPLLGSDEQSTPEPLPRLNELFPKALFPTAEALHQDWEGEFAWTVSAYEPGFYPGKSTFFFTWDGQMAGWDVDWHKVAEAKDKEVEVHIIASTHDTCKTKHLHALTEPLRMCLNKVQAVESA